MSHEWNCKCPRCLRDWTAWNSLEDDDEAQREERDRYEQRGTTEPQSDG